MVGLDHGENCIRGVVLFQVMRNLVEGSARVRVPRTGAGTRATGMRSDARRVQAKSTVVVMVEVGVEDAILAELVGGMSPSWY